MFPVGSESPSDFSHCPLSLFLRGVKGKTQPISLFLALTEPCCNISAVEQFFRLFLVEITMLVTYSGERGSGR